MPRAPSGYGLFFRQCVEQFHTTGAVMPSGRPLAAALCRYVGETPSPQRVLEVGPGTGAVTRMLVRRMRDGDDLRVVEVNAAFVAHLRSALAAEGQMGARAVRVEVVHGRVEDLPGGGDYDVIVSGLPLNNFSAAQIEHIFEHFARLLRPGGVLSFFQYMAVRTAKTWVSPPRERARLRAVDALLRRTLAGELRREWVWPNMPPAWVHHVRLGAGGHGS